MAHWLGMWLGAGALAAAISLLARVWRRSHPGTTAAQTTETILTAGPVVLTVALIVAVGGHWDRMTVGAFLGLVLLLLAGFVQALAAAPRLLRIPLLGMAGAAVAAVAFGIRIDRVVIPVLQDSVAFGRLAAPLTVVWIFAITAAFYTTGRLDGLPLALTAASSSVLFVIISLQAQTPLLARALAVSAGGAAAGMLGLAMADLRPPARGATAMVCGFLLAITSILGASKTSALLTVGVPLILFAFPMIGMTTIAFDRLRQSMVVVEVRQDIYSLLLGRGLPRHKAIILIAMAQIYLGGAAILMAAMRTFPPPTRLATLGILLVIAVPLFGRLLSVFLRREAAPAEPEPESRVLDMRVDPVGMGTALNRIETFIRSRQPHHVVTGDTIALARTLGDASFRDVVNAAHMVTADGVGVVWAARVLGVPVRERVSGIDLMEEFCRLSAAYGYRLFFLGGKPGVAQKAAQRLTARFAGLTVVGTHHGYFSPADEPAVLARVREASPDALFVALGSPRQDHWISQHMDYLGVPVCIGVGGSFDVFAGELRRAPRWMRRFGLEWLYRAIQEPWRVRRWVGLPKVIGISLKKRLQSYWS